MVTERLNSPTGWQGWEKTEDHLIVVAHFYGTPGKIDEIRAIADKHGALIVEDAAESLGATYRGQQTGTFGDLAAISFNDNNVLERVGDIALCNKAPKMAA